MYQHFPKEKEIAAQQCTRLVQQISEDAMFTTPSSSQCGLEDVGGGHVTSVPLVDILLALIQFHLEIFLRLFVKSR